MNLAAIQRVNGREDEAMRHYRSVVALELEAPDELAVQRDARTSLAWLLATSPNPSRRDPGRAISLLEPIAGSDSATPAELDALAASYAAAGRFDEATAVQRRAIDTLAAFPAEKTEQQRARYEGRLRRYENGNAFYRE